MSSSPGDATSPPQKAARSGTGTGTSTGLDAVTRRPAGPLESARANRHWWDAAADGYQDEHGRFLGDADFVWGPEGLREADARLLGPVAGRSVLEIGCGAAQCARWLMGEGAERVVALDVSFGQLQASRRIDARLGTSVPVVQADAQRLPFATGSFDIVCSAYGGVPFVADSLEVMREVARVLRPGGRWAFSVTHPIRWAFPDDPGPAGLTARDSYFDRRPYVEQDESGRATYVEHHRTLGDRVRELTAAGLRLLDLVEPEWPAGHDRSWGGWSPLRGRLLPGTAVFVCEGPAGREA
ncbi:class I SAM-dependent methyltransferase [Motilibacter aurantiacus]|uniref:class I SAM-dependent methyltransferase n=1 Tax=Motilibacter aurantiacus TaxID=2714955 RepID=UPI00140D3D10|nr:class I SAM-dependent methyltransferase [Motilibacter aurantiacus]